MPTSIQDPLPVEAALQGPRAIKVADRCAFAIAIRAAVCTEVWTRDPLPSALAPSS